ncbi:MAG: C25 family cysteine peptidase [Candidatus Hydrothermales bacterium]
MNIFIIFLTLTTSKFLSFKKEHLNQGEYIGKLRDIYVFIEEAKREDIILDEKIVPLSFYPFYKKMGMINAKPKPQGFLIITNSSFLSYMNDFILWKKMCGYYVVTEVISGGESPQTIKNIIVSHYQNDSIKPEYVLLVGDVDLISPFYGSPWAITDNKFVTVDDDFIPDILIGRISVSNIGELLTYLSKVLNYEKNPYVSDTMWYKRSLFIGARYPQNVWTAKKVKKWIREFLLIKNYFKVIDTVFYPPTANGVSQITSSCNNGVLFVNYRGGDGESKRWIYPQFTYLDVDNLSNGFKLPIITSFVCLTGAFHDNAPMCLGEKWIRAGTATNPRGGIAFIGSGSGGTHTKENNILDEFFYKGYSEDSFPSVSSLLLNAKLNLISHIPNQTHPDSGVGFYFHTYNILGDPSLLPYKGVPKSVNVTFPSSLSIGASSVKINVKRNGIPLKDVWVSVYKENEARDFSLTDENGDAFLNFKPLTSGNLFVVVRGFDVYTQIISIPVVGTNHYIGINNFSFSDSIGHNDFLLTPSEIIKLNVSFKNFGSQDVNNVVAKLSSFDEFVNLIDTIKSLGNFQPNEVKNTYFKFKISPSCTSSHVLKLKININSNEGFYSNYINSKVYAPKFKIDSFYVIDENFYPEPGNTEYLVLNLKNIGNFTGYNVSGILRTQSPKVTILDSISNFGKINFDSFSSNNQDPFFIEVSQNAFPGEEIKFELFWNTQNEGYGKSNFNLKVCAPDPLNATGPSKYGYYVIDDEDTIFSNRPSFSWIEIDPAFGGSGIPLNMKNDTTKIVNLPFNFKYYGINYDKISVSDNGYIIFGSSNVSDPYNWPIPSKSLPDGFVSSFWDDLDPEVSDSSRDVYIYNDTQNHFFIIEWSRVQHIHNYQNHLKGDLVTFQIILYDPNYYQTQTGDGIIKIQYLKIKDDDSTHNYSTIGFESPESHDGIQISFNKKRANGVPLIKNGRAFLITTNRPQVFVREKESEFENLIFIPTIIRNSYTINLNESFKIKIFDSTGRKIFDSNGEVKILKIDRKIFKKSGQFYLIFERENVSIKKFIYFK